MEGERENLSLAPPAAPFPHLHCTRSKQWPPLITLNPPASAGPGLPPLPLLHLRTPSLAAHAIGQLAAQSIPQTARTAPFPSMLDLKCLTSATSDQAACTMRRIARTQKSSTDSREAPLLPTNAHKCFMIELGCHYRPPEKRPGLLLGPVRRFYPVIRTSAISGRAARTMSVSMSAGRSTALSNQSIPGGLPSWGADSSPSSRYTCRHRRG